MIMAYDQSRLGIANLQINCLRLEKNPVTICGYFSSTCIDHIKPRQLLVERASRGAPFFVDAPKRPTPAHQYKIFFAQRILCTIFSLRNH